MPKNEEAWIFELNGRMSINPRRREEPSPSSPEVIIELKSRAPRNPRRTAKLPHYNPPALVRAASERTHLSNFNRPVICFIHSCPCCGNCHEPGCEGSIVVCAQAQTRMMYRRFPLPVDEPRQHTPQFAQRVPTLKGSPLLLWIVLCSAFLATLIMGMMLYMHR
jgi:hypothetical protein